VLALVIVLVLSLSLGFVVAQESYIDEINSAFTCMDDKVDSTSLSLEEAIFTALAGVENIEKANDTINSAKSASNECWPSSGCNIKDTAQVAIVKESVFDEDVGNITEWLLTKSGVTEELTWYLQITIEGNGPASCIVNYDDSDYSVEIGEDMKLVGSAGSCFTLDNSDYWLRVSSGCLDKEFNVQCGESFKTNLLYQKDTGGVIFVSSQTHSASSGAWTLEEITAKCFKEGSSCDYEASLWATVALYANNQLDDVGKFAPYLRAFASDNEAYFPSAFLVSILEGGDEHYSNIIDSRQFAPGNKGYWEMPSSAYNKYYDTSLAMLALGGGDSSEIENGDTLGYLFDNQDSSGCWNNDNLRDTAFLIYSAQWFRSFDPLSDDLAVCGDGVVNGGEACDGSDLNGGNCTSLLYDGGDLGCVAAGEVDECTFDINSCTGTVDSVCEDGVIEGAEVCDGSELNNATCISRGYDGGELSCASDCLSFDIGLCTGIGPGDPPSVPNSCSGGFWYESILIPIDTTQTSGYCHLEPGITGCCPTGYTCSYDEGNESESICVSIGGGYNPGLNNDCESAGLYCVPRYDCLEVATYTNEELDCSNPLYACCPEDVPDVRCNSLNGNICIGGETCSGSTTHTSDGECCLDACLPGNVDECGSDADCASGRVCLDGECVIGDSEGNGDTTPEEGSNLWVWIISLVVLILIVILGIIYKDRLRVWWFKMRGKAKTSRAGPRGPPGGIMARRPIPRFGARPEPVVRAPVDMVPIAKAPVAPVKESGKKNTKEKERDDTFKKLREMSK